MMKSTYGKNFAPLCFAVIMFCTYGCGLFETDDEFDIRPAQALRVEVAKQEGRQITFWVTCSWPNGCGQYSHFTARQDGNQFTVQVFGGQPTEAVCTAVIIRFIAPVKIQVPVNGAYDFHFWQSETTSIDTSLVIE